MSRTSRTRRAAALAVVLAGIAHGAARAEPDAPDPAVQDASEANLESIEDRRGLTFSAALGGGLLVGFGIEDSVGRGGSLSLRLGRVATRRTVITFEVSFTAALHRPSVMGGVKPNTSTNLLAGAQHYVNPSLWLRLAGGVGVYQGREVTLADGTRGDLVLIGPAVLGGLGVDLLRFKSAVLGIEFSTSAMVNREGVLVASGADLALSFD